MLQIKLNGPYIAFIIVILLQARDMAFNQIIRHQIHDGSFNFVFP